jgi:transposase
MAVDTLGRGLALRVTAANEQDRAQVQELVTQVQAVAGETVEIGFVDQAYTGERAAQDAAVHGIKLEVVK